MERLKTLAQQYLWLIVIVGVAAVGTGVFLFHQSYQERKVDREIEGTWVESKAAVAEAVLAEAEASNVSVERRTEDAVREAIVRPRLETARKKSANSKIELEKARDKYNEIPVFKNANHGTWADNCTRLMPDRFPSG